MRSKESLLRNFFQNVEVVIRSTDVCQTAARWTVRLCICRGGGGAATCRTLGSRYATACSLLPAACHLMPTDAKPAPLLLPACYCPCSLTSRS